MFIQLNSLYLSKQKIIEIMKIDIRKTTSFIELKTDELECTLFEGFDRKQILETIENFEYVIEELKTYLNIP